MSVMVKNKTNKNYKRSQRGRSMVEMLGVLAIVGVLSVGGVYGYGVAMKKHKANELLHQASMQASSIAAQIASGKTDLALENFGNSSYGTFSEITQLNDEQFEMKITDMDEAVCAQVAKMAGGMVRQAECDGTTLTLTYNNNLSSESVAAVNNGNQEKCEESGNKYCVDRSLCVSSSTDCCNGFEPSECATACENETVTFVSQGTPCSNSEGVCDGKGKCDLCAPKINSSWNTLCYSCNPETGEITFNDQKRGVFGDQGCCQGFLRAFNNDTGSGACYESEYGKACGLCNFGICLEHYQGYIKGLCEYGAEGSGCASDEHCDSGLKCVKASGSTYGKCADVTHPEHYCKADENCNEGYVCFEYTCRPSCESSAECSGENVVCGSVLDYENDYRTLGPICYSCPTNLSIVESNGNKFCCDSYGYAYTFTFPVEACCTAAGGAMAYDYGYGYSSCCYLDENGHYDGYDVTHNYTDYICCDAAGGYMNEYYECVL